ncbi:MAG: hypothetical protein J5965_19900 [Aeriscardovia sp.]|nr:hypothetical protein [Aeriscardovia sp.]MBQ5980768.1 hypothetical protein [Prevotella sp.]
MEVKKLNELKGSEKLKIQASVLEMMEDHGFTLDRDLGIVESNEDSCRWVMAFQNKKCRLEDLVNTRQILGEKFNVEITSKSKENFLCRIEAPGEEFVKLGQSLKPLKLIQTSTAQSQPSTGVSQQQQSRTYVNSQSTQQNH